MVEIIPAIIAQNFDELKEKIDLIDKMEVRDGRFPELVNWVQIDVMDGKFVLQRTFNKPAELANLKTSLKLEAHLMIDHPWDFIDDWLAAGVKRIIVHYEAVGFRLDAERVFEEMIAKCHLAGCQFSIALNPETPADVLDPYILKIDTVQIMGVKPGRSGQPFMPHDLLKVERLREKYPNVKIELDGGVNIDTAPVMLKAGVDMLVVGSAIWQAEDRKKAIEELRKLS